MGQHCKRSRLTAAASVATAAGVVAGTAAVAAPASAAVAPVHPESHAAPAHAPAVVLATVKAAKASPASYKVRPGDSLSAIAAKFCGSSGRWPNLWGANYKTIGNNPNLIYPAQLLRLACDAIARRYTPPPAPPAPVEAVAYAPAPAPAPAAQQAQPAVQLTGTSGGTLSCAGLEALWESAGGPAYAAEMAAAVAEDESGGQQYAENPSGASGYWQILGEVVPGNVFDPAVNAENAVAKWRAEGDSFFPAWTTAGEAAAAPRC